MSTTIEVRADAREFALYRKLVDSDWNRTTQESVLALIWQVIAESAVSSKDELACLLKFPAEKEAGKALETAAL